jgi:hypothetical protein
LSRTLSRYWCCGQRRQRRAQKPQSQTVTDEFDQRMPRQSSYDSVQRTMICFRISGCLTASAKHGAGLVRATCSRKDGTAPDCKGALRKCCDTDRPLGERGLNEKEIWRRVELGRKKPERKEAHPLIRPYSDSDDATQDAHVARRRI